LQDLVAARRRTSGVSVFQLGSTFGDLFEASRLTLQAVQITRQVCCHIAELESRRLPTARPAASLQGLVRLPHQTPCVLRREHRQRATSLIIWAGQCVNGRLRRISKIISGLQTHSLGRQRDVLAWCR
jgi:hypothetical protein